MHKEIAKRIVIAMWIIAYGFAFAGLALSFFGVTMNVILACGALGATIAFTSEKVIDHYDL